MSKEQSTQVVIAFTTTGGFPNKTAAKVEKETGISEDRQRIFFVPFAWWKRAFHQQLTELTDEKVLVLVTGDTSRVQFMEAESRKSGLETTTVTI